MSGVTLSLPLYNFPVSFHTVFPAISNIKNLVYSIVSTLTLQQCRQRNSMGTMTVSDTLKLNLPGTPLASEGVPAEEEEDPEQSSSKQSPKPEDLGNTRGKRMAMKFVNKIASKDKYTKVSLSRQEIGYFCISADTQRGGASTHLCHDIARSSLSQKCVLCESSNALTWVQVREFMLRPRALWSLDRKDDVIKKICISYRHPSCVFDTCQAGPLLVPYILNFEGADDGTMVISLFPDLSRTFFWNGQRG